MEKKVELDFGSLSLNGMLTSQCRSSRHTFAYARNFLILPNDPIRSQIKIHFFGSPIIFGEAFAVPTVVVHIIKHTTESTLKSAIEYWQIYGPKLEDLYTDVRNGIV